MRIADVQPQIFSEFSKILEQGNLSHAYLFSGGFGSFEFSIWLSQAIFCENPNGSQPCGQCRSCRLVEQCEFADLHLVEPEGQTIKTAQIRGLTEVFNESGYESTKKVLIIREAEKMHQNAANALLKSIEEPESDIHVFLLTENENLILPTIKSRTQVISFPKNMEYFQDFLEKQGILKTQAELLSQTCSSMQEALEISQTTWFAEGINKLQQFVKLLKKSTDEAFLYVPTLLENFDDKPKQRMAFDLFLQLAYQERLIHVVQKIFYAIKMWKSNVRFDLCLTHIILEQNEKGM